MKATDTLKEEHRVIERVLVALEKGAKSAAQNKVVRPEFFVEAAEFSRAFTDDWHHKKEEEILFKTLADNGVQVEGGPVGTMQTEHEQARQYLHTMQAAAEAWAAGDATGKSEVIWAASSYTTLLRQHIQKENSFLFALAEQTIPADEQNQVAEAFNKLEGETGGAAVREKYSALAEALEQEAAAWK